MGPDSGAATSPGVAAAGSEAPPVVGVPLPKAPRVAGGGVQDVPHHVFVGLTHGSVVLRVGGRGQGGTEAQARALSQPYSLIGHPVHLREWGVRLTGLTPHGQ